MLSLCCGQDGAHAQMIRSLGEEREARWAFTVLCLSLSGMCPMDGRNNDGRMSEGVRAPFTHPRRGRLSAVFAPTRTGPSPWVGLMYH